jgi:hypothetical protein
MEDFVSTAAAVRTSVRRLRELTDQEAARGPRRSLSELAEAAASAAAAAAEARLAVEEARRAEECAEEARRLRSELLSVLHQPSAQVDCELCRLSGEPPRGAQLRCDGAGGHGLCAGCAADAWSALATNLAYAFFYTDKDLSQPAFEACFIITAPSVLIASMVLVPILLLALYAVQVALVLYLKSLRIVSNLADSVRKKQD